MRKLGERLQASFCCQPAIFVHVFNVCSFHIPTFWTGRDCLQSSGPLNCNIIFHLVCLILGGGYRFWVFWYAFHINKLSAVWMPFCQKSHNAMDNFRTGGSTPCNSFWATSVFICIARSWINVSQLISLSADEGGVQLINQMIAPHLSFHPFGACTSKHCAKSCTCTMDNFWRSDWQVLISYSKNEG